MKKEVAVIYYLTTKFDKLYQTLLYKLLFYIDFFYYDLYWNSLTDTVYYKLPFWPVPLSIKTKIDMLIADKKWDHYIIEDKWDNEDFDSYKDFLDVMAEDGKRVVKGNSGNKFNVEMILTKNELSIIESVLKKLISKTKDNWDTNPYNRITTKWIVEFSHKEDAYKNAEMYQPLFYWFSDSLKINE